MTGLSEFKIYSELVYSSSVRVSLAGEETNSVWNLVSLWVHGWVAPDWYKYPEYCAQPKHPRKADILHSKEIKLQKLQHILTISTNTRRLPWSLFYWFLGYQHVAAWRRWGKLNQIIAGVRSKIEHWSVKLQRGPLRYLSINENCGFEWDLFEYKERICVNWETCW